MEKAGKIAIATFVMRTKQYLAAIRPEAEVLTLETMFFADEVRDPVEEIEQLPAKAKLANRDLDMAVQLIESMATPWEPENYRDTYRERVLELIDAKREGHEVVTDQPTAQSSNVVDLMAALKASVEAAKNHQPGNRAEQAKLKTRPSGQGTHDDLESLTKKELYALAQDLDIDGRSTMSSEELKRAVRAARSEHGAKERAS